MSDLFYEMCAAMVAGSLFMVALAILIHGDNFMLLLKRIAESLEAERNRHDS